MMSAIWWLTWPTSGCWRSTMRTGFHPCFSGEDRDHCAGPRNPRWRPPLHDDPRCRGRRRRRRSRRLADACRGRRPVAHGRRSPGDGEAAGGGRDQEGRRQISLRRQRYDRRAADRCRAAGSGGLQLRRQCALGELQPRPSQVVEGRRRPFGHDDRGEPECEADARRNRCDIRSREFARTLCTQRTVGRRSLAAVAEPAGEG